MIDTTKPYIQYCYDVLSGAIVASKYIQLACQRTLDWFNRSDIYFDYDDVDRKINFISKLKHSTGSHANKPFILLPWQQWVVANIFGWKWKATNYRVTKKALLFMARKCGKTAFASALALAHTLVDNEPNAEVELVANSRQQAGIAMEHCQNLSESVDPKKRIFRRYRGYIKVPVTKSSIQVLSSDAMGNDGYNSSLFIIDEFHAMKDWALYNVMVSSQGMRTQPLGIVITTAGFLLQGYPCYDMRQTCCDILQGLKEDDTQFSALYELDENDNWEDENTWVKAIPSLGHTVLHSYVKEQIQSAKNNPALEVGVRTKNLNQFMQSKEVWLADELLRSHCEKVDLADYQGEYGFMGVDLSAVSDLTAFSIMLPPNPNRQLNPDKFVFKSFVYVPQSELESNTNYEVYRKFRNSKHLNITSGNVVDYDYILDEMLKQGKYINYDGVYYDSWNATAWAIDAETQGLPLEPYSQALGNFNKPTKTFEILLKKNKVVIDYNPCVLWCFGNAELKSDYNDNVKPVKSAGDRSKKIDPVIAMLEALGGYLSSPHYNPSIFVI